MSLLPKKHASANCNTLHAWHMSERVVNQYIMAGNLVGYFVYSFKNSLSQIPMNCAKI
jgi:hypothetical protein